ncbi:hypothetical protein, conserved [Babesia bigemina]|uniref:HTH OST-type domain-containing protein n=1 Tax=Babesia bigemina TaxID=5866 RepID=A0A061D1A2_BABBI|nr:hypothetical protein, conserved [Babesia bigemina]CDR93882.1 hypothetical protein, conserved [Babesia bigemina]|eukprot:XP_012766068.1 hypothetical protein, conserved [Babesia bigemina]
MARVLCTQVSTSTNGGDDFCSTGGYYHKLNCCSGLTSAGCVSSYCQSPEAPNNALQWRIDVEVEKVLSNVYDAICELYNEEIFPTLHEIRRKLQRNNASLVDGNWLLRICKNDSYRRFQVFIMMDDTLNAKDHNLQGTLHSYHDFTKIGGRYLFAEHLRKFGPSRFRQLALGKLVRIVQVALDSNILSYNGTNVIPSVSSTTSTKKLLSQIGANKSNLMVRREDQIQAIRNNIILILSEKPPKANSASPGSQTNGPRRGQTIKLKDGDVTISVCKLPVIYKKRFNQDLDFTKGGYSKLTDFLRNEVPECSIQPCPVTQKKEQPKPPTMGDWLINHIVYQPSTNIFFPLAMRSSRLTVNAANSLIMDW